MKLCLLFCLAELYGKYFLRNYFMKQLQNVKKITIHWSFVGIDYNKKIYLLGGIIGCPKYKINFRQ